MVNTCYCIKRKTCNSELLSKYDMVFVREKQKCGYLRKIRLTVLFSGNFRILGSNLFNIDVFEEKAKVGTRVSKVPGFVF